MVHGKAIRNIALHTLNQEATHTFPPPGDSVSTSVGFGPVNLNKYPAHEWIIL